MEDTRGLYAKDHVTEIIYPQKSFEVVRKTRDFAYDRLRTLLSLIYVITSYQTQIQKLNKNSIGYLN